MVKQFQGLKYLLLKSSKKRDVRNKWLIVTVCTPGIQASSLTHCRCLQKEIHRHQENSVQYHVNIYCTCLSDMMSLYYSESESESDFAPMLSGFCVFILERFLSEAILYFYCLHVLNKALKSPCCIVLMSA